MLPAYHFVATLQGMGSSGGAGAKGGPKSILEEVGQAFLDLMMAEKTRFGAVAAEFGFSPMQAMTLFSLDPAAPVPMSSFAQRIRCEPSNVTGVIDKLEARGLVERRATKDDRRVKLLYVTAEGAKLRAKLSTRMAAPQGWMQALPAEDQRRFRDILRKALAHAGEGRDEKVA